MQHSKQYSTGGVFLVGLFVAIMIGHAFFLPILFATLACTTLLGAWNTRNADKVYGGLNGAIWLLTLAVCFATDAWYLMFLAFVLCACIGGRRTWITSKIPQFMHQQPAPLVYQSPAMYQPTPAPQAPVYRPYEQGYSPSVPTDPVMPTSAQTQPAALPLYAEQYDQPLAQYPEQTQP